MHSPTHAGCVDRGSGWRGELVGLVRDAAHRRLRVLVRLDLRLLRFLGPALAVLFLGLAVQFLLLQLLEFRHIDNRLDERLKTAYGLIQQLAQTNRPIWRTHARRLRDLGALKVEVNLMFENARNALTLVGDPYVARVYDQVATRFHLDEWGQNIQRSISVLESIYQVVSNQAASYRAETLEVTVVLLIIIEILLAIFRH